MVMVQAVQAQAQLEALEAEDQEEELASAQVWHLALGSVLVQAVPALGQVALVLVVLVVLVLALEELVTGLVELGMDQVALELDWEEPEQDLEVNYKSVDFVFWKM